MVKEIGIRPDPALSIAWQTDICGCVLQAGKLTLSDFSVFTTDYKMKYAIAMMALISLLVLRNRHDCRNFHAGAN